MSCPDCQRRSALVAALAPAISLLSFNRHGLLALLALEEEQLLRTAKVEDPRRLLRDLQLTLPTESVPTALCRHDPDYPEALAQLECAPAVLYATCTTDRLRELRSKPTVAIIGGRQHTHYARDITLALARDLTAAGVTIVSGINRGLEATAQHSALDADGHTIAVMPGAPQLPYSSQHKVLHRQILRSGVAISEFPPGFFPMQRWCFIACQRIVAALAEVVVIVEARGKISALLVAQVAADVGADVAVVPARVTDPGGLRIFGLLRDGAHPISCAQDVLQLIHDGGNVRAMVA
jgi:DNA processing protein